MARQARAVRPRRLIVEAAGEVFDEVGYTAASTTEILARSGVTRGALYFHFPSKEAIADAVVAYQTDILVPRPGKVRLQAVIDLTMEYAERLRHDPVLRGAVRLSVEQAAYRKPDSTPYEGLREVVLGLLREARGAGELLPGVDEEEIARLLVGAFTGIQLLSQAATNRADLLPRISVLWRYLLPALAVPGLLTHLDTSPRVRPGATVAEPQGG